MVPRKFIGIQSTASLLVVAIFIAYCIPSPAVAQTATPQTTNPQPSTQDSSSSEQATPAVQPPAANQGAQPAQGSSGAAQSVPQPVTTYPDATSANPPEAPQPKASQTNQVQSEPQGAATAEKVNTAGGAAAKPAGVAIAPAKQHQARSLLIKVGAVLAAGAAAGTVYALSRGTSSTPPGANGPGVVQKR